MTDSSGLYQPSLEHDACGIGFIASITGNASHQHITDALTILENMEHRGASGCENNSGDGAGILIQMPHQFFAEQSKKLGFNLPPFGRYGVGVIFFPKDKKLREECRFILNDAIEILGMNVLGYRIVPVDTTNIGETALSVEPVIEQIFISPPACISDPDDFERKLFVLRNYATHTIQKTIRKDDVSFYISSLSHRIIIYKGQLTSLQLRTYYPDLSDPAMVSAFGLVHSRFATNTFPSWKLAQPLRYIAHNGEINTLQGNLNWLKTSEQVFHSPYFSTDDMKLLLPVIQNGQSDSACLDNMIELLTLCGRSLPHVMMMLIPEAWDGHESMDPAKKAFYEFHASIMEPWDGPAAVCFTDGKMIGATLDRNGLRPGRYCITTDDRIILASETGVLPIDQKLIKEKGRLQPGKMFVVDLQAGRLIRDEEVKQMVASQQPYTDWLNQYKIRLEDLDDPRVVFTHLSDTSILKYQKAFGYNAEDVDTILRPMALDGKEPVGSMGADTPLAVLSHQPQHLSSYFKQLFAQVTNPPIDPLRERLVMSLTTFVGNIGNLLIERPEDCHTLALKHPILTSTELEKLRSVDTGMFQSKTLPAYFRADGKAGSLQKALGQLCQYAEDAARDGFAVIILSDRALDSGHAAIPSLLATAAVHHHLIRKGLRGQVGLVIEAGDVWEVHHFACLVGFGATAINPYLALASIRNRKANGTLQTHLEWSDLRLNYINAVCDGLLKVFSKMGISTFQSYQGAQIFEILGLNKEVVNQYFTGAISRIEGMSLDDIAKEALAKHENAFSNNTIPDPQLPAGGNYQWNRQGEFHLFNPQTIHLLQYSTRMNDYSIFKKYSRLVNDQSGKAATLRSLFEFKKDRPSVSIDDVEPAENIYKRFATGAMSFGSISWEAHTTLARAMNRLGGKSNTGEGGEDESRYATLPDGDSIRSAIKQVASARFGVTSLYLTEADELQIKMAQGAKPGEGGQLPGHKVDEWIGRVRHATPGVGLISPPPHHDIYSIEDLAQLIFDLKNANRHARINVKLVSEAGVGTIAAGVVKAKADVVLISGHDGGTGASPLGSIRHTGLPWELGLAETHQTLMQNKLRSRVVLQTDGQLKTGRDIAIATLLGAEEWGVATAALVVEGCIMMRKCHLNTCPVGVATQDPELRKRFTGDVDHVVTFFKFLTEEFREIMAELGFKTVNEMVGQVEMLQVRDQLSHWKSSNLDLSPILYKDPNTGLTGLFNSEDQDHGLKDILDWNLLEIARPAIDRQEKVYGSFKILNTDRTTGTLLSHEVTKKYRAAGLPEDTIHYKFTGTAGQSFGAFTTSGITLELEGDANDCFGKGVSGAKLIVYPPADAGFIPEESSIIGNVALYGATSGEVFIHGQAGERFAVRNSGANVVVEGVGDHGCEYMTGGKVIILGNTGRNFAAGMSGGLAYVFDVQKDFFRTCNTEMIELDSLGHDDILFIKVMLEKHIHWTNSTVAKFIISDFENQLQHFVKVFPKEYKRILETKKQKVVAKI